MVICLIGDSVTHFVFDFECAIFKCNEITFIDMSSTVAFMWMGQNATDDKLILVTSWCHQALPELMLTPIYVTTWRH